MSQISNSDAAIHVDIGLPFTQFGRSSFWKRLKLSFQTLIHTNDIHIKETIEFIGVINQPSGGHCNLIAFVAFVQ